MLSVKTAEVPSTMTSWTPLWWIPSDAQAERMSFGSYRMSKASLLFGEDQDHIAGPFEILGHARDPNGDDWARWVRFKEMKT